MWIDNMNELPDMTKDLEFSPTVRIIQTPHFKLQGKILPKYPEDIMAYYYAARTQVKRMEIDQDRRAKNAKETIEKLLDTWGYEAATYIRTSYENDATTIIAAYPHTSIADVKGYLYQKYWYTRDERETIVSQVLASNGKVLLMYKGECVVPDMNPPKKQPSFFHKLFGK